MRREHHAKVFRGKASEGGSSDLANRLMRLPTEIEIYLESLKIGQGRLAGSSMTVLPWQSEFIQGAFGQDDDAALSVGRGNGKTVLCAGIMSAAIDVDGPLAAPQADAVMCASSFDQGTICFRFLLHFLKASFKRYPGRFRVQDSTNRASIQDRLTGARAAVLSSDPRRMHGLAPKLLLLDEVAQWPETTLDAAIAALRTSRGKIEGSRALWIGTRPGSESHPFARKLKGVGVGFALTFAADPDSDPFEESSWRAANPSYDFFPDLAKTIKSEAEDAKKDPAELASFRALRLNQGVSDTVESVLVDSETWRGIEVEEIEKRGRYVLGLDLGSGAALSAASGYWPLPGSLDAFAVLPYTPNMIEKGRADGVGNLYQRMLDRHELRLAGSRVADVGGLLAEVLRRWGKPSCIVADRYRQAELLQELEAANFPHADIVFRGQGFKDGAEDVRRFRKAILDGRVTAKISLLQRSAMAEARTISDPAGNSKLAKGTEGGRRARGRDDAAASSILAIAEGVRRFKTGSPSRRRRRIVAVG